jgi:hypothetical protein
MMKVVALQEKRGYNGKTDRNNCETVALSPALEVLQ